MAGDAPTFWVARHMQGPLGAFALAAPVGVRSLTVFCPRLTVSGTDWIWAYTVRSSSPRNAGGTVAEVYGDAAPPAQALGPAPADHPHRAADHARRASLVVADRFGALVRRAGDQRPGRRAGRQPEGAPREKPDVTVEGFPFLTQVLAGKYQEIKIELRDFAGPAGNGQDRSSCRCSTCGPRTCRRSLTRCAPAGRHRRRHGHRHRHDRLRQRWPR